MRATLGSFPILLALQCVGCAEPDAEIIRIHVDLEAEPIAFSWSGGKMHEFEVAACDSGCVCDEGKALGVFGPRWSLSIDIMQDPLPPAHVASPVQYGIVDGEPDPAADPLEPGVRHFVTLARYVKCEDEPEDCAHVVALGCSSFVAP